MDECFPNLRCDELVFVKGLLPFLDVIAFEHPLEMAMEFLTGTQHVRLDQIFIGALWLCETPPVLFPHIGLQVIWDMLSNGCM